MKHELKPNGPHFKILALAALAFLLLQSGQVRAETSDSAPKRSSYVPESAELMKKLGPATAKVMITQFDVPVNVGSGFFINKEGLLITSRQLMRPVLADSNLKAEFILNDKKVIRDFKVVTCGDLLRGDLCALKLNVENKAAFALAKELPTEGEGASVIGHPRGFDFSITRGTIRKVVSSGGQISKFEIAAPIASGNSGGPVFDDQGRLIGIAAKDSTERPSQHWVVPALGEAFQEILNSPQNPATLAESRKLLQENLKAEMKNRAIGELDPALGFAVRSKALNGLKGFKEVALKFDNRFLRMTLPEIFDDCGFSQKTHNSTLYTCSAFNDAALLTIQRLPGKGYEDLLAKNGKRIMLPKAFDLVEQLQHDEAWDMYGQVLSPTQIKSFYSEASPAQCQSTRVSTLPQAAFSDVPACRFSVSNDTDPGGHSINIWILKDQYLYSVAMWMNDALMADYFARVPILSILTARWEKSVEPDAALRSLASDLDAKPLPTYKIELPEPVSFMGAKIEKAENGGLQLDLYGKKLLLDSFEDGFVVAVTNQKRGYLPPDFSDVAKKTLAQATKALGVKIQKKTIEIESMTIAGRPGRMVSAFGANSKGHDILVLSGAIFYEDQTFEITQIASSKDTAGTFKEFKSLLDGFKRK